jgi:hypothetical protein
MAQPIIVPKGESIYLGNRYFGEGAEIPAELAKQLPKGLDWKPQATTESKRNRTSGNGE